MASVYQTLQNVFDDVRYIAGKDSTTLPDSDLMRMSNKYFLWLMRQEADLNENLYGQISYTDLVADQEEYPLPADNYDGTTAHPYGGGAINIMRVEITYDGANWKVAKAIDLQDFGQALSTDASVNNQSVKVNPVYYFFDRSIFIAPIPGSGDVTTTGNNGLRIWYLQRPGELDATSDIFDLPKEFLTILSEGILMDVFRKYGRMNDMRIAEGRFNAMIEDMRSAETNIEYQEQPRLGVVRKDYN